MRLRRRGGEGEGGVGREKEGWGGKSRKNGWKGNKCEEGREGLKRKEWSVYIPKDAENDARTTEYD